MNWLEKRVKHSILDMHFSQLLVSCYWIIMDNWTKIKWNCLTQIFHFMFCNHFFPPALTYFKRSATIIRNLMDRSPGSERDISVSELLMEPTNILICFSSDCTGNWFHIRNCLFQCHTRVPKFCRMIIFIGKREESRRLRGSQVRWEEF